MADFFQSYIFKGFLLPFLVGLSMLLFFACGVKTGNEKQHSGPPRTQHSDAWGIQHAIGFDLLTIDDIQILEFFSHFNERVDTTRYLLVKKGVPVPASYAMYDRITVPVRNMALLHASYISYFRVLDATEHIKAISEVKYVYDDSIYNAGVSNQLPQLGYGETLDKELLLSLDLDLLITVGWPNAPNKNLEMFKSLGLTTLVFSEWQETSLLGRAEWLKVVGALTGRNEKAKAHFDRLANSYDSLKRLTKYVGTRPKVLCNLPYKGSWFVPGGNSYMSHLFEDASAHYLWDDDGGTGGLQLDFETVFVAGSDADFWINPGGASVMQDIYDQDERLAEFAPVRNGNVFNCNKKTARGLANDYWESGIVHPELILADLIHILHPEVLPDHQSVYFKRIQ
jgi:iron complex transport system substrate-binding protein